MNKLLILREYLPFLSHIPDTIYFGLADDEFHIPNATELNYIHVLEEALDVYIMPYDRRIFRKDLPKSMHLCARMKGAKLTKDQKELLTLFENGVRQANVSFVAYQKPLKFLRVYRNDYF